MSIFNKLKLLFFSIKRKVNDPNLSPCPKCSGFMKYLPYQESGMTAEAKFGCAQFSHEEFRGGWLSDNLYSKH